jgi:hypothetical protein
MIGFGDVVEPYEIDYNYSLTDQRNEPRALEIAHTCVSPTFSIYTAASTTNTNCKLSIQLHDIRASACAAHFAVI